MRRGFVALVLATAIVVGQAPPARADAVTDQIATLESGKSQKVRLSAAIALSKMTDDRAVIALADALVEDKDAAVRRVAALALKKMVTSSTGKSARKRALDALAQARKSDKDKKVKKSAAEALAVLEEALATRGPAVFVNIDAPLDHTKQAPAKAVQELGKAVKAQVKRASKDYAVDWQGALPTGDELQRMGTKAFIISAAVVALTTKKTGKKAVVSCTVKIRVAPWGGADGNEKWVDAQTGTATGSGEAHTGVSDKALANGALDCIAAVGEQLTDDEVVPFIRRLAK